MVLPLDSVMGQVLLVSHSLTVALASHVSETPLKNFDSDGRLLSLNSQFVIK